MAVHGVYGPGTRPYMTQTWPCTRPAHGRVLCTRSCLRPVYTAVHGRERTVYMVVHGPCTVHGRVPCTRSSLRPVYTAVNVPGTRPCTGHVPCTWACLRLWPVNMANFTGCKNCHVHGRKQPCTRSVHGGHGRERLCTLHKHGTHARVHGIRPCIHVLNTAVFTVRTRLCTRTVNTPVCRVHGRKRQCSGHGRTMYMARARSCTQSVHGPGRVPCTWAAMYTGRKHGRVHHDTIHTRHRKSRQQKLVGRLLLNYM